ncbi:MAG: tetratricopeptide repeat protein [Phyllobacteriaceae bacterium]|nr:tetratricopeptide repeat protein [Phyllobacteriaceae bacterium]
MFVRRLFAALAFAAFASAASAAENPATEREALAVVQRLIAAERYDEAVDVVRRFRPQDKSHDLRLRLTEGPVREAQGDFAGAAEIYRAILARQPGVTAARVRLARALAATGDRKGARHHLDLLIAAGVDDRLGGRLSALGNTMNEGDPFSFSGSLSLLPSTNVNGGTNNTTVWLGNPPRHRSGIASQIRHWHSCLWRGVVPPAVHSDGCIHGHDVRHAPVLSGDQSAPDQSRCCRLCVHRQGQMGLCAGAH